MRPPLSLFHRYADELQALRARLEAEAAAWQSRLVEAEEKAEAAAAKAEKAEAEAARFTQQASLHKDVASSALQAEREKAERAEEEQRQARAAAEATAAELEEVTPKPSFELLRTP